MGFWSSLIGGTSDPIKTLTEGADSLFTSDEERKQLDNDLESLRQKPHVMQALANVTAANHRTVFVAGGRPALLWVAAAGLTFFFPVKYAVGTFLWAKACLSADALLAFPFSGNGLMELVGMLLGLGTMRTVEKLKGKAK